MYSNQAIKSYLQYVIPRCYTRGGGAYSEKNDKKTRLVHQMFFKNPIPYSPGQHKIKGKNHVIIVIIKNHNV